MMLICHLHKHRHGCVRTYTLRGGLGREKVNICFQMSSLQKGKWIIGKIITTMGHQFQVNAHATKAPVGE